MIYILKVIKAFTAFKAYDFPAKYFQNQVNALTYNINSSATFLEFSLSPKNFSHCPSQ